VNPAQFPDRSVVSEYLEPMVMGTILSPDSYTGKIMSLCLVRRGGGRITLLHEEMMNWISDGVNRVPEESQRDPEEHAVHRRPAGHDEVPLPSE